MIQILMLLLGAEYIRKNAIYLYISGGLWFCTGVWLFYDATDGHLYFPLHLFGYILLFESIFTLIVAASATGTKKNILFFKGGLFILVSFIILIDDNYSNILLAIIFGFTYFIIGLFTALSAWVVRFPRWKISFIYSMVLILFSFFLITHRAATVSYFLGFQLIISGLSCIAVARKASFIKNGRSVFQMIESGTSIFDDIIAEKPTKNASITPDAASAGQDLIVHIWTPTGSAKNRTLSRPVINRYIAAVDVDGVISTGHAALEIPGTMYISLYPAEDLDRSPSEFMRLLKATHDNDVKGVFQPDYKTESANWCESVRQIRFTDYDIHQLLEFWKYYQQRKVYNLTYRNCSSSVAYGLESALDGVLYKKGNIRFIRLLLTPELWIASQVRKRALAMAWTPGLVMDYARALYGVIYSKH